MFNKKSNINKNFKTPFVYKVCVIFENGITSYMFVDQFVNKIMINKNTWSGKSNYLKKTNNMSNIWIYLDNNTIHVLSFYNLNDIVNLKDISNNNLLFNGYIKSFLKKQINNNCLSNIGIKINKYNLNKMSHIICFQKRLYERNNIILLDEEIDNILNKYYKIHKFNLFVENTSKIKIKNLCKNIDIIKQKKELLNQYSNNKHNRVLNVL